jgi:photosystem II stability/assembly factor-like uncharacterized protein
MPRQFRILVFILFAAGITTPFAQAPAPAITADTVAALRLRNIGPANMSGRFVDMAVVESDPYTMYVASSTGGIFRTSDNGITWTPVFEHEPVHSVGDIDVFQPDPSIIWVGTGERANRQSSGWGDGVYKSTDGGKTWRNVGLRDSHHIGRIVTHPTNADVVFVAAMGHLWGPNKERGLYRTTDGGRTWQPVLQVDEDTGVVDVAIDPSDPNILYAASYQRRRTAFGFHGGGPGSALHKSTDGGSTWRKLTAGLPAGDYGRIGISIYRKDPRIVYISLEQGLRYNASTAYIKRLAGIYRSEDRGESWTHMSDWNPRPMYASQITVDPSDDKRIYMVNSYSFSDDGGRTFTSPRQSLHGDDRFVWVNPKDSRHVVKLDDGSIGISYDRGLKWLFVSSLPVSQFYRVTVDMKKPYFVYGGLQDNGCWMGPSATYDSNGVLNEHWSRLCGGDGFFTVADPTDNRTVYASSQFLGLTKFDMTTNQVQTVRPGNPQGYVGARRNWETWGKPGADQFLGNAMNPANWDAPIIISPHDPKTIYAGANHLWKSSDQGVTWTSLGDMTTGVDRSTLPIMGQKPNETTLSLDDGVPYYPGVTAIAESPLQRGLLYVGTDDGNLKVSRDGGRTWTNVAEKLPGAPKSSWIGGIDASRHIAGAVYVALDNHRSDDFTNYVFKSTDFGATWTSIAGDLPAGRVARTVREDPKNRNLLYLATEFGFFFSPNGGANWVPLKNNMPTVPVNDFVIHPRDNDLVLATHGRGIWILDNVAPLQQLTPETLTSDAHLFTPREAEMIRYTNSKAHAGDMIFRGQNPPAGAVIDYYLRDAPAAEQIALSVHSPDGREVVKLQPTTVKGLNRVVWNLRHAPLPGRTGGFGEDDDEDAGARGETPGPFVVPGEYAVRLVVNGRTYEQKVVVKDDPRLEIAPADRRLWTETLLTVADLFGQTVALNAEVAKADAQRNAGELAEARRIGRELQSRLGTLYNNIGRWTGRPTADQNSQLKFFRQVLADLQTTARSR